MKLTKAVAITCVTFTGLYFGGNTAQAAVTVVDDFNVNSEASVTLEAEDTVDPTGPVVEPTDPETETGNEGPLRIDMVPNFDFGIQKIGATSQAYPVIPGQNAELEDFKVAAQVTDARGTGIGWNFEARISKEFTDAVASRTLDGAVLKLGTGELFTAADNATTIPSFVTAGMNLNDALQPVMTADTDEGLGNWAVVFSAPDTTLTIPAGSYAGSYTAEVEWVLSTTPDVDPEPTQTITATDVVTDSATVSAFTDEAAVKDFIITESAATALEADGTTPLTVTINGALDAGLIAGTAGSYSVILNAGTVTKTITVDIDA